MAGHLPPGRQQRPQGLPPQVRVRAPQRAQRSASPLRIVGYTVLGLACLLLAVVSFVFVAAPVDLVRDRLVEEVKARTGRDLVIGGPVSLALYPRPGVTLTDVTLSEPPGQTGSLLSVKKISTQVSLSDLLARRVHIRRVLFTEPGLTLRVDANGVRNWDFAGLVAPYMARVRFAQMRGSVLRDAPATAAVPTSFDVARLRDALEQVLPGELVIERGSLSFRDARNGEQFDVSGIDLEAAAAGLNAPVEAKGTFTLRGQPMAYTARIASLDAALASGSADVVIKAEGAPLTADFGGKLALQGAGPQLDGNLVLKSASIPALGLWLGRPVAMEGPTDLSFSGRVQWGGGRLSLPEFESVLAGRPAKGTLAVDFTPRRPKVTGQLQVASLDLGAFLLRHPADTGAPASAPANAAKPDPIGDLLRQRQTRTPEVRGFTQRAGAGRDWSDERLDTRLLALADADLRISASQILHRELKTGPGRIALTLNDRNLRIDLEDIALYGGRARGVASIDAAGATPALSLNLNLDGVSAGPFLKDAADFEWLDGRTSVVVALAGQGFSEREIVETLSGTVEMKTLQGHLSGINLPKVIRSLEMGQLPNLQIQPAEKTPFSELAGQFVITKGIAHNNDLRLTTPNARITGTGVVQLPARQLSYDVRAKVSGTGATQQQGALVNFANIEIPIHVEGPWDKPVVGIKGQEQILDGLKQIGKNLKNPDVQDALRGLLGGNSENRVKPRDLLDKLLKKE